MSTNRSDRKQHVTTFRHAPQASLVRDARSKGEQIRVEHHNKPPWQLLLTTSHPASIHGRQTRSFAREIDGSKGLDFDTEKEQIFSHVDLV